MPNPIDPKDNSKYDKNHRVRAGNISVKTSGVWHCQISSQTICHVERCCDKTAALSVLYSLTVVAF